MTFKPLGKFDLTELRDILEAGGLENYIVREGTHVKRTVQAVVNDKIRTKILKYYKDN